MLLYLFTVSGTIGCGTQHSAENALVSDQRYRERVRSAKSASASQSMKNRYLLSVVVIVEVQCLSATIADTELFMISNMIENHDLSYCESGLLTKILFMSLDCLAKARKCCTVHIWDCLQVGGGS